MKLRLLRATNRRHFAIGVLTTGLCSATGGLPEDWRYVTALPQAATLHAAWSPGPEDLFVGGESGAILRWKGATWTTHSTPTQKTVLSLHGTSGTDIWAVGGDPYSITMNDRHLLMHFDGTAWREMAAPEFGDTTYVANAVHALAPNDVWVTIDGGTWVQHYDGSSWQWVSLPLTVEGTLRGIGSVGTDHLFLVGTHGQIIHRDHGVWKLEQRTETGSWSANILGPVWAPDLEHVFVGGNWGQVYARNADGTWTDRDLGLVGTMNDGTLAIAGTPAGDLMLMGTSTIRRTSGERPVTNYDYRLKKRRSWVIGAPAGDRLYAVGTYGVVHEIMPGPAGQEPVVSSLTVGDARTLPCVVKGVAPLGGDRLLVWGFSVNVPDGWPLLLYREGHFERWPLPPGMETADAIVTAALGTGPTNLVIAWNGASGRAQGVHRWDGTAWTGLGTTWTIPWGMNSLGRAGTGAVWGCTPTQVVRWQGDQWEVLLSVPVESFGRTNYSAIWCRSDTEVYVGLAEGRILRFNAGTWSNDTTPAGAGAIRAFGEAGGDLYAVGTGGLAWRRTTSGWQALSGVEVRQGDDFTHLALGRSGLHAAQSTAAGIIGGGLSRIWRLDGGQARRVIQGIPLVLAFGADSDGYLHAIAERDAILTDRPAAGPVTLARSDLASADWSPLGTSGVAIKATVANPGTPMVAVRYAAGTDAKPPTEVLPGVNAVGPRWIVATESYYAGTVISNVLVRFTLDPASLPADFPMEQATLFRSGGEGWQEVATEVDPVSLTLTTRQPTRFSAWTFAAVKPAVPPTLSVGRGPGVVIQVRWPVGPGDYVLESSPGVAPAAAWSTVPGTPVSDGDGRVMTLPAVDSALFYRLRSP